MKLYKGKAHPMKIILLSSRSSVLVLCIRVFLIESEPNCLECLPLESITLNTELSDLTRTNH